MPQLARPGSPGPADHHPRLPTRRGTCRCWCSPATSTRSPPRPRAARPPGRHGPVRPLDPGPQRHARQRHGRPGRLRLGTRADVHQGPGRAPADERVLRGADAEVRVVGTFPATLARVTPATARPGDRAGRTGLQAGRRRRGRGRRRGLALVLRRRRAWLGPARRHLPVHRGRQTASGSGSRGCAGRSDTRVSGTVWWNQVSGRVWARLTVARPGGSASVRLWYFDYVRHSVAHLSGRYRGQRIAATMPALRDRSPARRPEACPQLSAGGSSSRPRGHRRELRGWRITARYQRVAYPHDSLRRPVPGTFRVNRRNRPRPGAASRAGPSRTWSPAELSVIPPAAGVMHRAEADQPARLPDRDPAGRSGRSITKNSRSPSNT